MIDVSEGILNMAWAGLLLIISGNGIFARWFTALPDALSKNLVIETVSVKGNCKNISRILINKMINALFARRLLMVLN